MTVNDIIREARSVAREANDKRRSDRLRHEFEARVYANSADAK